MSEKKTNGNDLVHSFSHSNGSTGNYNGLTKREHFAGQAMEALIKNAPAGQLHNSKEGTRLAIQWADDLIHQLNSEDYPQMIGRFNRVSCATCAHRIAEPEMIQYSQCADCIAFSNHKPE